MFGTEDVYTDSDEDFSENLSEKRSKHSRKTRHLAPAPTDDRVDSQEQRAHSPAGIACCDLSNVTVILTPHSGLPLHSNVAAAEKNAGSSTRAESHSDSSDSRLDEAYPSA